MTLKVSVKRMLGIYPHCRQYKMSFFFRKGANNGGSYTKESKKSFIRAAQCRLGGHYKGGCKPQCLL